MQLTFLGTSEATPTRERSQTAILLQYENEHILIDCGEGTQRQFKIAQLNPCKLTRILITHWHGDHVLGLPGLLQTLALNSYSKTLHVYGPRGTKHFFQLLNKIFVPRATLKVEVHELTKDGLFLDQPKFQMFAYRMKHACPCLAYRFQEKDRRKIDLEFITKKGLKPGPELGKLQRGKPIKFKGEWIKPEEATYVVKGKSLAFIFDTLPNPNCIEVAKNVDLLVIEACFLEAEHLEKAKERFHLTASQAGQIGAQAKVNELILTHLSQRYSGRQELVLNEAKKFFKNCKLSHDFMTIKLS